MLAPMRAPTRWLLLGITLIALGIVPIFPAGIRVALGAAGAVLALVAMGRIHTRPHIDDYDQQSPNTAARYQEPPYGGSWGP
jgi:hypothetical protein